MRAIVVKRVYKPGPVTTRAAGLGWLFFWILLRSCPGLPAARSGAKLERPQPRSGEDERAWRRQAAEDHRRRGRAGCGWIIKAACWFPVLAGGVVSQAPIRRRASARLPWPCVRDRAAQSC